MKFEHANESRCFFIAANAGLYHVYLEGGGGGLELAKFGMDGAVSPGMKLMGNSRLSEEGISNSSVGRFEMWVSDHRFI